MGTPSLNDLAVDGTLNNTNKLSLSLSLPVSLSYPVYMEQNHLNHNLDRDLDPEFLSHVNTRSGSRS